MPVIDKSTLHGLSLVLMVSASLTLLWLLASIFDRRGGFYAASPATIATADRTLAHFGSWEAMAAAEVVGEDGIARVKLSPRTKREN